MKQINIHIYIYIYVYLFSFSKICIYLLYYYQGGSAFKAIYIVLKINISNGVCLIKTALLYPTRR